MKCPKCRSNMLRSVDTKGNYYYVCPECHTIVGKKEEHGSTER